MEIEASLWCPSAVLVVPCPLCLAMTVVAIVVPAVILVVILKQITLAIYLSTR
jgi:hypothetical protein